MNYLNIPIEVLSSEEFIGSLPVERATWLCLMKYCAHHETGGRIVGAGEWGERKLIGLLSVTKEEIRKDTPLWEWDGADIIVWGYPIEQEAACQAKRDAGRRYGKGHPKGQEGGEDTGKVPDSLPDSLAISSPDSLAMTERKGKERKEKKRNTRGEDGKSSLDPKKVTWLTPFNEVYEPIFEADIPFGKVSAPLKAVVDKVGSEEAVEAFRHYCLSLQTEGKLTMFSAPHFKNTLAQWRKKGGNRELDPDHTAGF